MNGKQIGLSALLVGFVGLNIYAVAQHGYVGVFEAALATPAGIAVFADLTIALGLILFGWLIPDARERGTSALGYVVLTVALGSVGPLLYLIRRERSARAGIAAVSARSAAP